MTVSSIDRLTNGFPRKRKPTPAAPASPRSVEAPKLEGNWDQWMSEYSEEEEAANPPPPAAPVDDGIYRPTQPIDIPQPPPQKIQLYREEETGLKKFEFYAEVFTVHRHGLQRLNGQIEVREDGQYVVFQYSPMAPHLRTFELDVSDDQHNQPDEGIPFYMDEDYGIGSFDDPEEERLHVPVEMPVEQQRIPYEDHIPRGVRSRRSGNERVHPSELGTAIGNAARERRERERQFLMEMSDADDEAEEEGVEAVEDMFEEPVVAQPPMPSPRRLFARNTCPIPCANRFRDYMMERRERDEMAHLRELAADPRTPRALDDKEFEDFVKRNHLEDDEPTKEQQPPRSAPK